MPVDDQAPSGAPDVGPAAGARSGERWRRHPPAVAGCAALTAAVLWPALAHFRTRAVADPIDSAMFTWLWDVMPRRLASGENPFRTDLVFHPVGTDLALTTTSPLIGLLTWPVKAAFGTEAQMNVLQLASMFFAAMATYLLAERVCRRRDAAFVVGAAFALLPARFVHVQRHPNLIETGVIPFGLLMFLRFVDQPTRGRAAALGATCGAVFLVDPQLAILLGIGLVALGAVHRRTVAAQARRLLAAVGLALLVAAPLLVPMAVTLAAGGAGEPDPTASTIQYSSSPLSWVVPPVERLWIGHALSIEPLTPNDEGIAYPGLVILGLALAGVAVSDKARRRGWAAIAMVGFVLSLGPYLFVRDRSLDVPLPFWLLRAVPALDTMRVPGRFAMLGALGLCVLAATALADLARRFGDGPAAAIYTRAREACAHIRLLADRHRRAVQVHELAGRTGYVKHAVGRNDSAFWFSTTSQALVGEE